MLALVWQVVGDEGSSGGSIVARQVCDYSINRLMFVPRDGSKADQLVAVGDNDVRLLRVRGGRLPGE